MSHVGYINITKDTIDEPVGDAEMVTVSHHLKILARPASCIDRKKRGTWAYSIVTGALDHIAGTRFAL